MRGSSRGIGRGGVPRGGSHGGRGVASRGRGSFSRGRGAGGRGDGEDGERIKKSDRTSDIDIHLASKISQEFSEEINQFKSKLQKVDFGPLDELFQFVTPQFIHQHLPKEIVSFRTYMSKFNKGSPNEVVAFIKWAEWAFYVAQKGNRFNNVKNSTNGKESVGWGVMPDDDIEALEENAKYKDSDVHHFQLGTGGPNGGGATPAATLNHLRSVASERTHMRALIQMCIRHNHVKRKEGQRALVNHLKEHLSSVNNVSTIAELKETTHQSVSYAITRLFLGMATDNASNVILNCHALFLVLTETQLHPRIVLTLLDEELSLTARMKVVGIRLKKSSSMTLTDEELDPDVDPDDINDPSKGERNQKIAAGLFATMAVMASGRKLSSNDVSKIIQFASFAYVEHKGNRVLSANLIISILRKYGLQCLEHAETWSWVNFAFFRLPKVEYYRPEAVQLLIVLMNSTQKPSVIPVDSPLSKLIEDDPLEPKMMEQLTNSLFRKDQVTAYHPMIHPVWNDILTIITKRCEQGESLKAHITNFVHVCVAPYRRGNMEIPRRALFAKLISRIGQLALQNADEVERMEVVDVASRTVGFGKVQLGKLSDPTTLRHLSVEELSNKALSLVRQYTMIHDKTPSASTQRTWVLKELRSCLATPVHWGIETKYVEECLEKLLEFAFFPGIPSRDEVNKNRAVYLFTDVYSYSFPGKEGRAARPHANLPSSKIIELYLKAESNNKTRFNTAVTDKMFRSARDNILLVLTGEAPYSVLFFKDKDIETFLTLLFLVISNDDPTNLHAKSFAESIVPDLCRFIQEGTIETIELFYDILVSIVMRPTSPLHIMPIMSFIRRIATAYLYRFARFINTRQSLDMVLAPLVDAYNTNDREIIRQMKSKDEDEEEDKKGDEVSESDSDSDASLMNDAGVDNDAAEELSSADAETENDEDADTENDEDPKESDKEDELEGDDNNSNEEEPSDDDADSEEANNTACGVLSGEEEYEEWADNAEEAPTQAYLDSLKTMVGDVDLGFAYPNEDDGQQKNDVVRAITIATRVSLGLRSPIVIHTLQVLLAVLRNNVKVRDPVIFTAAKSSIEMLLMSKYRFFGSFLPIEEFIQILGDIQSYCRKVERALLAASGGKDSSKVKLGGLVYKRLSQVKSQALSVLHYMAFLAHKNFAGEDIRIAIEEHYIAIFFDKGWKEAPAMAQTKRDLYHFRHAFAWVFVPAAIEKFRRIRALEGSVRAKSFVGTCKLIMAFLSRMSGLPPLLRKSSSSAIVSFLSLMTPVEIFDMKHTAIYDFCYLLKMVIEYNSKVQMDDSIIKGIVKEIIDNDNIKVTKATILVLDRLERLMGFPTPCAKNIKAPVPVKVLYKQFEAKWRSEKSDYYRKAKIVRKKTIRGLLAHRNQDLTDEDRSKKRRRREELKKKDEVARMMIREERRRNMTKEERMERRKKMLISKQDRIAKNKERKKKISSIREQQFQKWKAEKLETE